MKTLTRRFEAISRWTRTLGPYLLIEVLLPGGSMIALLLFLYRRRKLAPVVLAS
jgi:hypothetical protein